MDEDLPVQTTHANETRRIPSGRHGQPIKELVEIANKTDQMSKFVNFPAIDYTSPVSEYDPTESVYVNSYPWLFPGGIGDLYDMERGEWGVKEWSQRLLHFHTCNNQSPFISSCIGL